MFSPHLFKTIVSALGIGAALLNSVTADGIHSSASRLRSGGSSVVDTHAINSNLRSNPKSLLKHLEAQQREIDFLAEQEDEFLEIIEILQEAENMSMATDKPTPAPTTSVSPTTSAVPSESKAPSSVPSTSAAPSVAFPTSNSSAPSATPNPPTVRTTAPSTSVAPTTTPSTSYLPTAVSSLAPTNSPTSFGSQATIITAPPTVIVSFSPSTEHSSVPSISAAPSASPSVSIKPSVVPSSNPTLGPTARPTLSQEPSHVPSTSPSASTGPSLQPSVSVAPSVEPSVSVAPSVQPSISTVPSGLPSSLPTGAPSTAPSDVPSTSPTLSSCGMTPEQRSAAILGVLDGVTDPSLLRDSSTFQGQAASWLIDDDVLALCPGDPKIVQRFVLAVIYFATNGPQWFRCSGNPAATDACGSEEPFVGDRRFLSGVNECQWAGISCNSQLCVNEIEFELNNLVGIIPTEIGLLKDLQIWGMERGGLVGQIPTEIGLMRNLTFLDLDFNQLTGSLSSELLSLDRLEQLDLNNNQMTGSIEGIGVFPAMEFLQLHDNMFNGTVPEAVGTYTSMAVFTLHETSISGTMPASVCDLLMSVGNGGLLESLIADCQEPNPGIACSCCTDCRAD